MRTIPTAFLALALGAGALADDGADVKALVTKLQSADSDVRRQAARDLGELGKDAKAAVPALTNALKDKDLFVRRYAAQALGEIGPDAKGAVSKLSLLMLDERRE